MTDARDGVRQALLALDGIDAAMALGATWTAIEDIREAVIESLREDAATLIRELDEVDAEAPMVEPRGEGRGDAQQEAVGRAGGETADQEGAAEARRAADRGE